MRLSLPTFVCLLGTAAVSLAQVDLDPAFRSRWYTAATQGANYMHSYYLPPAPSSTPWPPAWSPDGKPLAGAVHGSICRAEPRTGAAAARTYGKPYHYRTARCPAG